VTTIGLLSTLSLEVPLRKGILKARGREFDNNFHLIRILGALAVIFGHAYPLTGIHGPPRRFLGLQFILLG